MTPVVTPVVAPEVLQEKPKVGRPSARALIQEWASNCSGHGIPSIERSRHPLRKTFWLLVVLTGVGVSAWQLTLLILDFYTYPVTVSLNISFVDTISFPAVTICNVNRARKSQLYLEGDLLTNLLHATYGNTNMTNLELFNDLEEMVEEFDRAWDTVADSVKGQIGHQIEDMLIECTFDGHGCDAGNFTRILNPRYGNCYAFNFDSEHALSSHLPGPEHGLMLELYNEEHEYIMELTELSGFRLAVHDQSMMPFPEDDGLMLTPNEITLMAVQKEVITRLPDPFPSNCWNLNRNESMLYSVYSEMFDVLYSLKGCQRTCYQHHVISECGCTDTIIPSHGIALADARGNADVRPCDEEHEPCMLDVKSQYSQGLLGCDCSTPCNELMLNFIVSETKWPLDMYKTLYYAGLANHSEELAQLIQSQENGTDPASQLVKVKVFFQDLNYEHIQEVEVYTGTKLLSDVGGTVGLYLGLSLAALFEFLELLLDLLRVCVLKCFRKKG